MRLLCLFSFLSWAYLLSCQTIHTFSGLDKKAKKDYDKVLAQIKSKQFEKATKELSKIISNHPGFDEGRKKLVTLYLQSQNDSLAIIHLTYLDSISKEPDHKVLMTLADLFEKKKNFHQAQVYLEKLSSSNKLSDENLKFTKKRLKEVKFRGYAYGNPVEFNPVPLGPSINTSASEALPAFNADGSTMIYTSMQNDGGTLRRRQEDLFVSYINEFGEFSKGIPLESLNTDENEGAHSFSQDGKTIIFTACNRKNGSGGCDLYISFNKNGEWSAPLNMGDKINSRYSETQPSLSVDNKTLYFCSTRKGGYGAEDIWKVTLNGNEWSEPINLGPTINTSGNEGSPFFHADNTTLYFRSDGHIGLGDYDLFLSRHENDQWSTPQNLGYPINSSDNDGALFVDLLGNTAYYTSNKENGGQDFDILKFNLPENLKPRGVSYLKLMVNDLITGLPLVADISLTNLSSLNLSKKIRTAENGRALQVVNSGDYAVTIEKEDYVFYSENIIVHKDNVLQMPFEFNISLQPISQEAKDNIPVVLKNIFFQFGSAELLEASNYELKKLYELLSSQPDLKIEIIGHTDNVGLAEDNLTLSEERAKSVYLALVNLGIGKDRLSFLGMGETLPISDNDSDEGRKLNRRTEFIVIN